MTQICLNCRYYRTGEGPIPTLESAGWCVRFPPAGSVAVGDGNAGVVNDVRISQVWTKPDHYCGEWSPITYPDRVNHGDDILSDR